MILKNGEPGPGAVVTTPEPALDLHVGDVVMFDGIKREMVVCDPVLGPQPTSPALRHAVELGTSFSAVAPNGPTWQQMQEAGINLTPRLGDLVSEQQNHEGARRLLTHEPDEGIVFSSQVIARSWAGLSLPERAKLSHAEDTDLIMGVEIQPQTWIGTDAAGAEPVRVLVVEPSALRNGWMEVQAETALGEQLTLNVPGNIPVASWGDGVPTDPFGPWEGVQAGMDLPPVDLISVPDYIYESQVQHWDESGWAGVRPGSVLVAGAVHRVHLNEGEPELVTEMLPEPVVVVDLRYDVERGTSWALVEKLDIDNGDRTDLEIAAHRADGPERAWFLTSELVEDGTPKSRVLIGEETLPVARPLGIQVPHFDPVDASFERAGKTGREHAVEVVDSQKFSTRARAFDERDVPPPPISQEASHYFGDLN